MRQDVVVVTSVPVYTSHHPRLGPGSSTSPALERPRSAANLPVPVFESSHAARHRSLRCSSLVWSVVPRSEHPEATQRPTDCGRVAAGGWLSLERIGPGGNGALPGSDASTWTRRLQVSFLSPLPVALTRHQKKKHHQALPPNQYSRPNARTPVCQMPIMTHSCVINNGAGWVGKGKLLSSKTQKTEAELSCRGICGLEHRCCAVQNEATCTESCF